MSVLDWIIAAALLLSLFLGAWRGLVFEVLSVLGWILAFVCAQWLAPDAGARLPLQGAGDAVRYAGGFLLVFVVAAFAAAVLARLVRSLFALIGLQPVDRVLGAAFGLVRGLVLVLAAAVVAGLTPIRHTAWWQESVGAAAAVAALRGLKPLLPQEFGRYVP
ncbi:MAG: CvpA family protein [Rhodoferax sp.]|nr:CvpA family protein [Rhodoferax sp.]